MHERLNPWKEVWVAPRKTLRTQLTNAPKRYVLLLATIGGILAFLNLMLGYQTTKPISGGLPIFTYILLILGFGLIFGIARLYFEGWLLKVTGKWLGGKGSYSNLRCGLAWSYYPMCAFFIARCLSLLFARIPVLYMYTFSYVFGLIAHVLLIWALILYFFLIAEAHRFSWWRAFFSVLIAILLFGLGVYVLGLVVNFVF